MSMKPPPSTPIQPASLAKQATAFAVVLGISGGYCAVGRGPGSLIIIAGLAGAVCAAGLLAVGIMALARFLSAVFRR